jgi:hypothetical protein
MDNNQDYRELVVEAANKIDLDVSLSDIDRAHPCGFDKKQLICSFTNYSARYKVYANRKRFRRHKDTRGVFVNENLTPKRLAMFKQLLALKKDKVIENAWTKKDKVIENAWTNDGRLFVWRNGRKVLVKTQGDIDALRQRG